MTVLKKYQSQLAASGQVIVEHKQKPAASTKGTLWDKKYIIDNLPPWVYTSFKQPKSVSECRALISATEYTLKDIDLQIEIRKAELERKPGQVQAKEEYERWLAGALRAKQTNLYLQSAYKYWIILNEEDELTVENKLKRIIEILIQEPEDYVEQLEALL